jgi:peptide-O-fucosyltransferase
MKEGNPFGPFWDELGVGFDRSEFTGLGHDVYNERTRDLWNRKFPPAQHPVLTFKGAPASFPVQKFNRDLQMYVVWNSHIREWTEGYVQREMSGEPYIAVHLRIGSDWEKACERAVGMQSFMESDQCLEDVPGATVTQELCLQTHEQIARHVKTLADSTGIHHVFIASDVDPRLSYIKKKLGPSMNVHYLNPSDAPLDLAVMGRADYFIGNCVSSFTAFVKRERDVHQRPTEFFGFEDTVLPKKNQERTEL